MPQELFVRYIATMFEVSLSFTFPSHLNDVDNLEIGVSTTLVCPGRILTDQFVHVAPMVNHPQLCIGFNDAARGRWIFEGLN